MKQRKNQQKRDKGKGLGTKPYFTRKPMGKKSGNKPFANKTTSTTSQHSSNTDKIITGRVRLTASGVGFIPEVKGRGDVEIQPEFLHTALHTDEVEVHLLARLANGKQQGEVTKILFRAKSEFVGVLKPQGNGFVLQPDDFRMYRSIVIPRSELAGASLGQKVLVRVTSWGEDHGSPTGTVIEALGKPGLHETEMKAIALDRGFDGRFPKPVEVEVATFHEIREEDLVGRKDFRNILTFTIDPRDAKDFDDALSFQELPEGRVEVGVHIADVSHYVRIGTEVEKEAAQRATSVYMVDRTIPMLPERLSNDLCSLKPNVDRLTFSAVFTISPSGTIEKEWFGKAVIHSAYRFAYEDAQAIIENVGTATSGPVATAVRTLDTLAKKIRKERMAQGAVEFHADEVKIELDKNGKPIRIYKKVMKESNKLIEEFMLMANKRVTEWIDKKIPASERVMVYRIHDNPNEERIRSLQEFLKSIGQELKFKGKQIHGQDLNAMLQKAEKLAEKSLIHMASIRSMAKAIYSTKNIGHFGLGFEHYTHFTSPIRRYPDLMVHRLLAQYLAGKKVSKDALSQHDRMCRYSTEMEIQAADAERASIKLKQVEYMAEHIGDVWDGMISGVTAWGVYVEDKTTGTEGMIHVRDLADDFYTFEETKYRLVGKSTKKIYRLGDSIKAKVREVDLKKRQIGLSLI